MSPGGVLLVDKPKGWTSHDVVAVVRKGLPRGVKVGHTGTLDPMATGLLVVLIGQATKRAALYQQLPKVYSGRIRLGLATSTGDLEGERISEAALPPLGADELQRLFDDFTGEVQTPIPIYSAVKHRGKPLYAYARAGIEAPRLSRLCRVYEWRLLAWEPPEASFRIRCSSGTYVRSLAGLVGERLNCGAVLSELRRESVGQWLLTEALSLERVRRTRALESLCATV